MGSPGLKFNPTEEELVFHYLRNKNSGIKEKLELIPEADVFKCEPWDLPELAFQIVAPNTSEGNSTTSSQSSSLLIRILSSIHGSPASAMELPPDWRSNKQILGLENATNSGTLSDPVISDPVGALTVKSKGTFEYPKLETASSGLRARSVERSNIVGGGKEKRRNACEHSAGPSSSSLVQPRAPSDLFSQLRKRVSLTGSVVLTRLFAAAFLLFLLFLLSSIMGIFASTYSAIAF